MIRASMFVAALLCAAGVRADDIPLAERRSGYEEMSPANRAMQDDDSANPATFWVLDGEALWERKVGAAQRACADCHGDARKTMRGVAARHPAFASGVAVNLEQRVNLCRTGRQGAPPLAYESRELLALTVFIARQSRGMPIEAGADERLNPAIAAGRALFNRRQGQLNLSCAQCHDHNRGRLLAGNPIPQGHPTGYPVYRLEWQGLGSLQRRVRNCLIGIRAETYSYGAPEYVALESYLMWRARGMALESPAVRP